MDHGPPIPKELWDEWDAEDKYDDQQMEMTYKLMQLLPQNNADYRKKGAPALDKVKNQGNEKTQAKL